MPGIIPVYSISKPFLAEAILSLNLPLHYSISKFLDGLDSCFQQRTISSLLNHTSGLDDYGDLDEYRNAVESCDSAWPVQEILLLASRQRNANSGFYYSNIGYLLLKMLLEKLTQLSYFKALTKLVFEPLNIRGFQEWNTPHANIPNYDPNWVYSGTFLSEINEIAPAILKLAKHRQDTRGLGIGITPVRIEGTGFGKPGYGYGFMSEINDGSDIPRYVGHGGGGPGFKLMALADTKKWKSAIRHSTGNFDQATEIRSLIYELDSDST